ncbi:MAG: acyl carrier protein [Lachnospiraceae bacterium]|nr:acyl carrier protein [Lachnospiraceae bacterium]
MEYEKLQKIISVVLGIEPEQVTMDDDFIDDLGADSLDVYQIIISIEDEFDIQINEEDAMKVKKVSDAVEMIKNAIN